MFQNKLQTIKNETIKTAEILVSNLLNLPALKPKQCVVVVLCKCSCGHVNITILGSSMLGVHGPGIRSTGQPLSSGQPDSSGAGETWSAHASGPE